MMQTSRTDIKRSKRQTKCPNSSLLGYSSYKLNKGDTFLYTEHYSDGTTGTRLGMCHGRVSALVEPKWYILTQSASHSMQFTYERWIDPDDVVSTVQKKHVNEHTRMFFETQLNNW